MNSPSESSIRARSLVITLLIHGLLFLLLFFFMIHIPIPPFPEAGGGNGGVLVNIGFEEAAAGDIQPMSEENVSDPNSVPVNADGEAEKLSTQELEEAALIKVNEKKKKKTSEKTELASEEKKEEKKIEIPVRKPNEQALYKGKNNQSLSQGTAAKGSGDQGSKTGDPNANGYGTPGNGNGNGSGIGNGTGNGIGDGTGNGKNGISYSLMGRKIIQRPDISDRSQETGRVVVEITVDKFGKVTKAIPGAIGTNTSSEHLYKLAQKSALTAKFNPSPAAAEEQKGTITFVFILE